MEEEQSTINESLKTLAQSSLFVFAGIIISKILIYFYRVIIARSLGPDVYGMFSIALMVEGWLAAISVLGLTEGMVRNIALYNGENKKDKAKYIFRFGLVAITITSIFSGTLLFFLSEHLAVNIFHNGDLTILLKIFSFIIPLGIISKPFIAVIQAHGRILYQSFILNVLQNVVKLLALILFLYLGLTDNIVAFSYLAGIISLLSASYLVCKYKIPYIFEKYILDSKTKQGLSRELVSYSWPVLFSNIVLSVFFWVDSLLIGYFIGVTEVGFYNAAVPIAALMSLGSELFMYLFFPLISREYSRRNFKVIKHLSQQVGKWIFFINFPLFILIILFSGFLIQFIFGAEYLPAKNALRLLAVGALVNSLFFTSSRLLSISGKSKLIFFDIIATSLVNIVLNLILLPLYGIDGAAMATMISVILLNLLFLLQANHYLSIIPLRRKIFRVMLVSIIPILFIIISKNYLGKINLPGLIILSTIFLILYVGLAIITGCLDSNDFMVLRATREKISDLYYKGVFNGPIKQSTDLNGEI